MNGRALSGGRGRRRSAAGGAQRAGGARTLFASSFAVSALSHLCCMASAHVMRFLGSTMSIFRIRSLASSEIGSQYGRRNSYSPFLIFSNSSASESA